MKINKLPILLGALAVVLSGGSAHAATSLSTDSNGYINETGTITINNVESSGDSFEACRIVKIKYNSSADSVSYEYTGGFQSFVTYLDDGIAYKGLTMEQFLAYTGIDTTQASAPITGSNAIDGLTALMMNRHYPSNYAYNTGECHGLTTNATTHTATGTNLPFGSYVIFPWSHGDNSKAYGAMIANLGVKLEGDNYVADNSTATLYAKVGDVGVTAKASKKGNVDQESFASTDTITFSLTATGPVVPSNATNFNLEVFDRLEGGYDVVSIGNIVSGGTTYVVDLGESTNPCDGSPHNIVSSTNSSLVVGKASCSPMAQDAVKEIVFHFNDTRVTPSPIAISYDAKYNKNNVTLGNKSGNNSWNDNTVWLRTPKNFYEGMTENMMLIGNYRDSDPSTLTTLTYGLRIRNVGSDGESTLNGAIFKVFSDSTCTTEVATIDMTESYSYDYKSLAFGEQYYIKETTSPTGYRTNDACTAFSVDKTDDTLSWDNYLEMTFVNKAALFPLPFTGGRGVVIYAIVGVGIVSIASVYYYRKKKQEV